MALKRLFAKRRTSAGTETAYTVPGNKETIVSTIMIINQEGTARDFTLQHVVTGDAGTENKFLSEESIEANGWVRATIGISMATTDVISITSGASSTDMIFIGWGDERDVL